MRDRQIHIIGAGLAGLACATMLADRGAAVALYEAGPQAGGRCRSFHDPLLDRTIDNGNHLILGANPETFRYLDRVGARDRLIDVVPARIPFLDLTDGRSWCLRPGRGPIPTWLLSADRRVPGTKPTDYLSVLRLAVAGPAATVEQVLAGSGSLYRLLWAPLAVSILNTRPAEGDARLLWRVFSRTLMRGEAACRPHLARDGLSDALVTPALAFLDRHAANVRHARRLTAIESVSGSVVGLGFADGGRVEIGPADRVVLAVPAPVAASLLPGLKVPQDHRAIVNAHFRLDRPVGLPGDAPLLGLVGGTVEWIFARGDIISVTVSAADRLTEIPADTLADLLWADVSQALGLHGPCPPARIIKEKRATFAATAAAADRRPAARTMLSNLFLAGDWTDTGLPATIEGAIQSGHTAASLAYA